MRDCPALFRVNVAGLDTLGYLIRCLPTIDVFCDAMSRSKISRERMEIWQLPDFII